LDSLMLEFNSITFAYPSCSNFPTTTSKEQIIARFDQERRNCDMFSCHRYVISRFSHSTCANDGEWKLSSGRSHTDHESDTVFFFPVNSVLGQIWICSIRQNISEIMGFPDHLRSHIWSLCRAVLIVESDFHGISALFWRIEQNGCNAEQEVTDTIKILDCCWTTGIAIFTSFSLERFFQ
jgi:hypothetical protein